MNIIIAPDSYKGSMSSINVAKHIKQGVLRVYPYAKIETMPMADGGEGTVEAMISNYGGSIYPIDNVEDAFGIPTTSFIGILNNGDAVIEIAAVCGLAHTKKLDILKASTFGVGTLIKKALDLKCKHIYIGLGGSATNDGGVGMAQALGISFKDANKKEIPLGAINLSDIDSIDSSNLDSRVPETSFTILSDVNNPLCGVNGATAVYGPQKGATPEIISLLDKNLFHLANKCILNGYKDIREFPGTGAAGGLGFGLLTFLNATLHSGIDIIIEASKLKDKLHLADIVITGEGRIDDQSINGKVPMGIAKHASAKDTPVIAIVGCIGKNATVVYNYGIDTIESCVYAPSTLEDAIRNTSSNIEDATERIMRSIAIGVALRF